MYLKSLALKGFKSFATPTVLEFEPGVTAVVGPNGSGKSNVVDALSWVMGEQGAKSLRGGKMEDVIFAGTSGKQALGRAEVSLTIDNSDGALPIDYTEVTISRIMFRSGGSEYAINGSPARLLDIQELLSDSGIGREMHVIVGQGQLDAILHATNEDRRGFVEEAAGVLKHRKRKEKALRKISALDEKLSRLSDLAGELRRQLKPLGKQAEVAKRAAVIQSDVRDAKLRILGDDLVTLTEQLAAEEADEQQLREKQNQVQAQLLAANSQEAELLSEAEAANPTLDTNQQLWFDLAAVAEKFRGLESLSSERVRSINAALNAPAPEGNPEQLEAERTALAAEGEELAVAVRERQETLTEAVAAVVAAEAALEAEEQRVEEVLREGSAQQERLGRLQGRVTSLEQAIAETKQALVDLAQEQEQSSAVLSGAQAKYQEAESAMSSLSGGENQLDSAWQHADEQLRKVNAEVVALRERREELRSSKKAVSARIQTLAETLNSADQPYGLDGRSGTPFGQVLQVTPGYEKAVTAALGQLADAFVADSWSDAADLATKCLAAGEAAGIVVPLSAQTDGNTQLDADLVSFVSAPPELAGTLAAALAGIVVGTVDTAQEQLRAGADRVVTMDGAVVARSHIQAGKPGLKIVELASQLQKAESEEEQLSASIERMSFDLSAAEEQLAQAQQVADAALAELNSSDAEVTAVAQELASHAAAIAGAKKQLAELGERETKLQESLAAREADLAKAQADLQQAPSQSVEVGDDRREVLGATARQARVTETDARLALRTNEERLRVLQKRVAEMSDKAQTMRSQAEKWRRDRERLTQQLGTATSVATAAAKLWSEADRLAQAANQNRQAGESRRKERDGELTKLRATISELTAEVEQLTNSVHKDEMLRAEQQVRLEQIREQALTDFGVNAEVLAAEYGPTVPVPPSSTTAADAEDGEVDATAYPYVRSEQERRLKSAERALSLLGRVNPLALEEFAALQERQKFLSEQIEDLTTSKKDLLEIVESVDDRIQQVFAEAFADTAREFAGVFGRLFPGGEGRLILTDPDNMLTSGIEVEARPPGKKIKRLSLLSGGERSLTAVAFLVALFKARPSPFYVLDEVEAALDDVNLGRLLQVIEELRADSQLIVITHQKRTMESADALYGVTMQGDGVSKVISQRLEPADSTATS